MAWLTTPEQVQHILDGCTGRGWPDIDLWWRDEARLSAHWSAQGWPLTPKAGFGVVPCGVGLVARIGIYAEELWAFMNVSEAVAGQPAWVAWAEGPPDGAVTLFNARDHGAAPKHSALEPDCRCAMVEKDTKRCRLGIVTSLLITGGAETVQLTPDGAPVSAKGQRWFRINGRDEAFDFYWQKGQTEWKSYLNMRTVFYNKQRGLTGVRPEPHARMSMIPGLPHRPPIVEKSRTAILNNPETSIGQKVAKLAAAYAAIETEFKKREAAFHATQDGTAAAEKAYEAMTRLEPAMAEAWDAWDAAEKQWIAELMD